MSGLKPPRSPSAPTPRPTPRVELSEVDVSSLVLPDSLKGELAAKVEERVKIEMLLESARAEKGSVPEHIYERVIGDYLERLDVIRAEYEPLKQRIVEFLQGVRAEEQTIREELREVEDNLQELRFRLQVGELDRDQLAGQHRELESTRAELTLKLELVGSTYETAQGVLDCGLEKVLGPPLEPRFSRTTAAIPVAMLLPPAIVDTHEMERRRLAGVEAKALAPPAWLTHRTAGGARTFKLRAEAFTLGRSEACDVILDDAAVLPIHAVVRWSQDRYILEDLTQNGGVEVNGEVAPPMRPLQHGDKLVIASALLEFMVAKEPRR